MKLTGKELLLDVLPKYLNYDLKVIIDHSDHSVGGIWTLDQIRINNDYPLQVVRGNKKYGAMGYESKPILYPLTKEVIEEIYEVASNLEFMNFTDNFIRLKYSLMGESFIQVIKLNGTFNNCPLWVMENFWKQHIDYKGLIKKGLAVNGNEA